MFFGARARAPSCSAVAFLMFDTLLAETVLWSNTSQIAAECALFFW